MSRGLYSDEDSGFRQIWRENHGTFLLAFTGLILVFGGILLLWPQQERTPTGAEILSKNGIPPVVEESAGNASLSEDGASALTGSDALEPERTLLRIRVMGVNSSEGEVRVAAYSDQSSFNKPEKTSLKTTLPAGDEVFWDVEVPTGATLAFSVFHDANVNGQLDRNLIGIPSEKYGFSRGARSQLGPPPFEEAAIVVEPGVIEVPIEIW